MNINPLTWRESTLKTGILAGIVLGVLTPLAAMAISSHHSEAAVAVIDQRNIEEAIKTAISTADILTTEQKELALKILDAKKLSPDLLANFMEKQEETGGFCKTPEIMKDLGIIKANGEIPSILNRNTTVQEIFRNEIGTIEDAMTGKKTIADLYLQTQKNQKALDATYKAAAERAQASQKVSDTTQATVQQAVEAASNAEGEQQLMQAEIQLLAAGILQQSDMRDLAAQGLAMSSEKWYMENFERAQAETRERAAAQQFANFVK